MKPQPIRIPQEILDQSRIDLLEDIEELSYRFTDSKQKYLKHWPHIQKHTKNAYSKTHDLLLALGTTMLHNIETSQRALSEAKKTIKKSSSSPELIENVSQTISELSNLQRSLAQTLSGLIVSTDWQSPSASSSLVSEAGRETGTIKSSWNDYKRDQHADAQAYEQKFKKEYIDGLFTFPVLCYATNSGMAAFTTILSFLQGEHKLVGPVLVGKSTWFEAKQMLKQILGHAVIEVDEEKMTDIQEQILIHQPSAIFLDTLGNNPDMPLTDITTLITFCKKRLKQECTIVLDNSSLGPMCQFMKMATGKRTFLSLIGYESLNKFHEFGMDRATGGIIYALGKDCIKLFDYREHMGTNISDVQIMSLPTPHRKILEKRIARIGRNTMYVALALMDAAVKPENRLHHIQYPKLTIHPSYSLASTCAFTGGYFMFAWNPKHEILSFYRTFVKKALAEAKKEGIQLSDGTSFGLPHSRVYVTAVRSTETRPFIRFSAGSETKLEIFKLANILVATVASFH
jgi:cystathionine beta-lyase/cystathionine gamma-synthase